MNAASFATAIAQIVGGVAAVRALMEQIGSPILVSGGRIVSFDRLLRLESADGMAAVSRRRSAVSVSVSKRAGSDFSRSWRSATPTSYPRRTLAAFPGYGRRHGSTHFSAGGTKARRRRRVTWRS
jgi:hypothetical protein